MSFLKTSAKQKIIATPTKENFKVSIVPNPVNKHSVAKAAAQKDVISQIQTQAYDLVTPNPAVKHDGSYKTKGLYAKHVSISDLTAAMKGYDLVMKVSGANNSCLQLTAADLEGATATFEKEFPLSGGTLKVGISKSRGNHYITSLDHTI